MARFLSLWLFIVLFSQNSILFLVSSDRTGELCQYSMLNYNKHIRSVRNNSDIVNVKLGHEQGRTEVSKAGGA
jgi:hypothetical protein